ncbi:hypothetical protein bAD24_III10540 [Burkholderia sp. AD24]|nr:hypothetical protein bAD24_III10540 [Burkholderia sp. AD24]
MANRGWDLAMRRIDQEFNIAQFLASALVRIIATNEFRLPAAERARFERLPDDVISRIEHIVIEAYLEAGEDVSEESLREDLWQQALATRREMIASGELISEAEFRRQGSLIPQKLAALLSDDSVFTLEVDGVAYFAASLAVPENQRSRVYEICRIIAPAPSDARLDFLTSPRERLGDRSPLEVLKSTDGFKTVSQMAEAWAAQWSRTVVTIFEGEHEVEPADTEPLYTAAAEVDPRRPLCERAFTALYLREYEWPLGPYPDVRKFSIFVDRQAPGDSQSTPEACVQVLVDGECIRIRIIASVGTTLVSKELPADKRANLVDIAKRVIANLSR